MITREDSGDFDFKISFLRKSKRLSYFFGISSDGADGMQNLYSYFSSENNPIYPNYLRYFNEINHFTCHPKNPVIFIFDNELECNGKPLSKFFNKVKPICKNIFKKELFAKLIGNLYLMTHPLINGKNECEIEDLFKKETLEYRIDGKSFSRKSDYDTNKYYGKEIFSRYVSSNYESIDFIGFRGLLDNLNKIIKMY